MLSFLFANAGLPVSAGSPAGGFGPIRVSDPQRGAVPGSVQHDEAVAGRRLSATELAELREQVRQQWAPVPESGRSPGERMIQGRAARGSASAAPRSPGP